MEVRFQIPGRVPVKKNTARHFAKFVKYSEAWCMWEAMAIEHIHREMKRFKDLPITDPVQAEFRFTFKNKQWEADVSNLVEGPQDVLEKCGVIENDKLIHELVASKAFGAEPGLEIILKPLKNSDKA